MVIYRESGSQARFPLRRRPDAAAISGRTLAIGVANSNAAYASREIRQIRQNCLFYQTTGYSAAMKREKGYLTTGEVARQLGVALNTAKRWIESGELHGIKTPGGHWRIAADDLQRFKLEHGIQTAPKENTSGHRVLIVDDNVSDCMLLTGLLEQTDVACETRCVHNGYSGLIQVGAWRPHVLVLDILMPGIDGLEVLQRLRSGHDGLKDMSIVVTTSAYDEPGVLQSIHKTGIGIVLPKPINAHDFLSAIGKTMPQPVVTE